MTITKQDRERAFKIIEEWVCSFRDMTSFYNNVKDMFAKFSDHAGDYLICQVEAIKRMSEIERDMRILIRKAEILETNRLRKLPVSALNKLLLDFFATRRDYRKKWLDYEEVLKDAIDETELFIDDWTIDEDDE